MAIRLIASDLDGTLLDDDKNLPERNKEALCRCAERGILIVPATGRTARGIPDEIRSLPGVRYAITTNGAAVMDLKEDRVVSSTTIPVRKALEILRLAEDSPDDIMYDTYIEGAGVTLKRFYDNLSHYVSTEGVAALIRKTRNVVPDTIAYVKEKNLPADKINFFFVDQDARSRMRKRLESIEGIVVSSAIPTNLEINAAGADKGSALLKLAGSLGISQSETMAFGDGENDLSMIRKAGIGVAMQNGEQMLKDAADHVTLENKKAGVAAAIERYILNENK